MKVGELVDELQAHDPEAELTERLVLGSNIWRGIACTALHALRSVIHMDGSQSAAWDVVESLICGG